MQAEKSYDVSSPKFPSFKNKMARIGTCCMPQGTQIWTLNYLDEWDGEEDGRGVQDRGDICILMTDSC